IRMRGGTGAALRGSGGGVSLGVRRTGTNIRSEPPSSPAGLDEPGRRDAMNFVFWLRPPKASVGPFEPERRNAMPPLADLRNQAVTGVVAPQTGEAIIRDVWPSVTAYRGAANLARACYRTIVLAPVA